MGNWLRRQYDEGVDPTGWGQLPSEEHIADLRQRMEHKESYQDDWEKYQVFDKEGKETDWGWRLRDETDRWWYEKRKREVKEYEAMKHWQETRLHKRDYDARREQIEEEGLGNVRLTPQITGNLISLRVEFPPEFRHLTNVEGQNQKAKTNANYHISLAYTPDVERDPKLQERLNAFLKQYFGRDVELRNIRVTAKGGGYELEGGTQFEHDLNLLVNAGTGKKSHISLD